MLSYPNIDPIALDLGFVQIRWYGISYVVGVLIAWWLLNIRSRELTRGFTKEQVDDLIFYAMLGVIIGGRLGSVLFYNLDYYLQRPVEIFYIQQGGMSFHGGLLGVLIALRLYAKKHGMHFLGVTDFIAPVVPVGLFTGRIANFVNGELWGKPSHLPWAIIFPDPLAGLVPRHPSQLYEAILEGLVLFAMLWWFSTKAQPRMLVSGLFLCLYGVFRFLVEFVREPDAQIGYLAYGWVTVGQVLSLPMIIVGVALIILAYRKQV